MGRSKIKAPQKKKKKKESRRDMHSTSNDLQARGGTLVSLKFKPPEVRKEEGTESGRGKKNFRQFKVSFEGGYKREEEKRGARVKMIREFVHTTSC